MARALIVIDVQNEYFDGALPISQPSGHLGGILEVMDAAQASAIPTVAVRHHQPDPESPIFRKDSEMWELHPEVQSRPNDLVLDKQLPGCFTNTNLQTWLAQRDIDTVTIAGYMTHICCDTTARQALHRGYKVEFLSDATGTLDVENEAGVATAAEMQRCILVAQQMFISEVLDRKEWIKRIA